MSANLVSKVYFPRLVLPIASAGSFLLDFCIATVVLFALIAGYGLGISWHVVFLPALAVFALLAAQGTFRPCTQRCGPRQVTPLPELSSFTSSTYHYAVGYPPNWSIQQQDGGSVAFSTRIRGAFVVRGQRAGKPESQLIQEAIAGLPSSQWQNVQLVAPIHGAHIGFQDGAGAVYSADLAPAGGQALKVRIAVLAASKGALSVTVMGIDPADPEHSPNGIPEADDFDYVLSEFSWPG
jgi:hypothetical protein